jgi:hypothetical protein
MPEQREPVSAVMGIRAARTSFDTVALTRALTAWQWERLDRSDALRDHVRDCPRCQLYPDEQLVVSVCRKGRGLARDVWTANKRVTEFRFLSEHTQSTPGRLF